MSQNSNDYVYAASLSDVIAAGCLTVQVEGRTVALFANGEIVFAVDNRCPHMGFPLDQGTVKDGILTCHWHHARFDLESGGTFDQWADDVRTFPVEIRGNEIWIDVVDNSDRRFHQHQRLLVGLERDIPLVTAKAVLVLGEQDESMIDPFQTGLQFGTAFRAHGWGQGLTILSCMMNILSYLDNTDRPKALYHGLSAVARDTNGSAPRFAVAPLPDLTVDIPTLKRWFRSFIEVRDAEGAERCIASAIVAGADDRQMADMLFSAATDHRYIQTGHVLDFTNKAFEALDIVGWDSAGAVLTSLVRSYAMAERMEEANSWRNPVDLVVILEKVFDRLPATIKPNRNSSNNDSWDGKERLVTQILGDDPQATVEAMLAALAEGVSFVNLASAVFLFCSPADSEVSYQ